jgi:Flp pilus assembly protein TadB
MHIQLAFPVLRRNPLTRRLPLDFSDQLARTLRQAGLKDNVGDYADKSVTYSLYSFFAVLFAGLVFFSSTGLVFSLLSALMVFALFLGYPSYLKRRRALEVEAELGVTLQSVSLLLSFGMGFDGALRAAPKGEACAKLFSSYERRVKSGSSPAAALASLSREVDSASWQRACAQLAFAYQQGSSHEVHLEACASQCFALQKASLKRYAAQLGTLGLAFVAAGCLLPAFFGIYALIAPLVAQPVPEFDIYLGFLACLALASSVMLLAVAVAPVTGRFDEGIRVPLPPSPRHGGLKKRLALRLPLVALSLFIAAVVAVHPFFSSVRLPAALFALSFPLGAENAWKEYCRSKRRAELEQGLPSALLMASTLSADSLERVPAAIAAAKLGPASEAFESVARLAASGYSYEFAFTRVAASKRSPLFSLCASFLCAAYANGFDAALALQRIGGHLRDILELRTDTANTVLVTKYTILASAAFFVPFILSLLLKVVAGFSASDSTFASVRTASQLYLLLFSIVGGLFVGLAEGDWRRGFPYS